MKRSATVRVVLDGHAIELIAIEIFRIVDEVVAHSVQDGAPGQSRENATNPPKQWSDPAKRRQPPSCCGTVEAAPRLRVPARPDISAAPQSRRPGSRLRKTEGSRMPRTRFHAFPRSCSFKSKTLKRHREHREDLHRTGKPPPILFTKIPNPQNTHYKSHFFSFSTPPQYIPPPYPQNYPIFHSSIPTSQTPNPFQNIFPPQPTNHFKTNPQNVHSLPSTQSSINKDDDQTNLLIKYSKILSQSFYSSHPNTPFPKTHFYSFTNKHPIQLFHSTPPPNPNQIPSTPTTPHNNTTFFNLISHKTHFQFQHHIPLSPYHSYTTNPALPRSPASDTWR